MPMDYYIWVAVSPNNVVVMDAGFGPTVAQRRGRTHLASPVDLLHEIGVAADDAGILDRPARRSRRVRPLCEADDLAYLIRANVQGRVRQLSGDATVVPGVTVHRVGGHTPGLQVVCVRTAYGHAVIASDASHFEANLRDDRPFSIVHTLPAMYDAFDRVRELADDPHLIVPGHDPAVLRRFSAEPGASGGSVVSIA